MYYPAALITFPSSLLTASHRALRGFVNSTNFPFLDMVLCASLDLQTKHLVAGAVRLMYAMFYRLFLGYEITIGALL